jgi:hypothetical protein
MARKKRKETIATVNPDDVKIRKDLAPPTRYHELKKAYRRKPKYGDEEIEEELVNYYFNGGIEYGTTNS